MSRATAARRRVAASLALAGAAAGAGCSNRPGAAAEQRQLNQAAAILDADSLDSNAAGAHESSPHD